MAKEVVEQQLQYHHGLQKVNQRNFHVLDRLVQRTTKIIELLFCFFLANPFIEFIQISLYHIDLESRLLRLDQ